MNTLQEMKEIIEAAIAGKTIEYISGTYANAHNASHWMNRPESMGAFNFKDYVYRVKPEPKPDRIRTAFVRVSGAYGVEMRWDITCNVAFHFDGETGELKAAEVIKP